MPDLSDGFAIPNAFGLLPSDFNRDMPSYRAALAFLSDLAGGTVEAKALEINGGNHAMLTGWQRSPTFRRVYGKCRAAGEAEREYLRAQESASAATEGEDVPNPPGQVFVPLEDAPLQRSVFAMQPNRASWGEA